MTPKMYLLYLFSVAASIEAINENRLTSKVDIVYEKLFKIVLNVFDQN